MASSRSLRTIDISSIINRSSDEIIFLFSLPKSKRLSIFAPGTKGENGNVTYEAAVPWRTIQLEPPKPNARFGYSFVYSDNDSKDMKGWLQLTPGIFGGHNAAALGWLILKK